VQPFEEEKSGPLCVFCYYNVGCRAGKPSEIGKPVNIYYPYEGGYYHDRDISDFIGIVRVFQIKWGSYHYDSDDDGNSSDYEY
jgi:hypothetical protein